MDVGGVGFEEGPVFEGVVVGLDEVGEVEGGAEFGGANGLHEVEAFGAFFAVDAGFVFVEEGDGVVVEVFDFGVHAAEDFLAVGEDVAAGGGGVVAEDADVGGVKIFGEFYGAFEAVEMFGPVRVDGDFADGGGDGDDADVGIGEFGADFGLEGGGEVEDIDFVDAAELDVGDGAFVADLELFVEVGGDFVGEGGEF